MKLRLTSKHLLLLVLGVYERNHNVIYAAKKILVKTKKLKLSDLDESHVCDAFIGLVYDALDDDERLKFYGWYHSAFEAIGDMKSFIASASTCLYIKYHARIEEIGKPNKKFLPLAE